MSKDLLVLGIIVALVVAGILLIIPLKSEKTQSPTPVIVSETPPPTHFAKESPKPTTTPPTLLPTREPPEPKDPVENKSESQTKVVTSEKTGSVWG